MSVDPTEGIRESLASIDPYQFEQFIADLWERQGWSATVSSESRDAGIDVTVRQSEPYEQTQVIQVKRYALSNKVTSSEVQQYSSLRQQVPNADTVVIVTTSGFTRDAQQRADELNVKLVDGKTLLQIIENNDAFDLVNQYTELSADIAESDAGAEKPTVEDSVNDVDTDDEMSTSEALIAVLQGLVALTIVVLIAFFIIQAVML